MYHRPLSATRQGVLLVSVLFFTCSALIPRIHVFFMLLWYHTSRSTCFPFLVHDYLDQTFAYYHERSWPRIFGSRLILHDLFRSLSIGFVFIYLKYLIDIAEKLILQHKDAATLYILCSVNQSVLSLFSSFHLHIQFTHSSNPWCPTIWDPRIELFLLVLGRLALFHIHTHARMYAHLYMYWLAYHATLL